MRGKHFFNRRSYCCGATPIEPAFGDPRTTRGGLICLVKWLPGRLQILAWRPYCGSLQKGADPRPGFGLPSRIQLHPAVRFLRALCVPHHLAANGDRRRPHRQAEKVLLLLASANRDEGRWERPDELDITRRVAGHIGFGTGIHGCVGQMVARLEGEAVLAALATRVASIEMSAMRSIATAAGCARSAHCPCISCGNSDAVQPAAASRISFSTLASSPHATASASALRASLPSCRSRDAPRPAAHPPVP
jgi:hypothetical protein